MPVQAAIKFTQGVSTDSPGVAVLGAAGEAVICSNISSPSVTQWQFSLVSVPINSSVPLGVFASGTGANPSGAFTPDVPGTYLVKLEVTDGGSSSAEDLRAFSVALANGWIIPAFSGDEDDVHASAHNFSGQQRGWAGTGTIKLLDAILLSVATILGTGPANPADNNKLAYVNNGQISYLDSGDEGDVLKFVGGVPTWGPATVQDGNEDGEILVWNDGISSYEPGRTVRKSGIGTGVGSALVLYNPTQAESLSPQYSPSLVLQGESFSGGARHETYARMQLRTTGSGTVVPTWSVSLGSAADGVGADSATLTDYLSMNTSALSLLNGLNLIVPGSVSVGSGAATAGAIRFADFGAIVGGTTNTRLAHVDASGNSFYGASDGGVDGNRPANVVLGADSSIQQRIGNSTYLTLAAVGLMAANNFPYLSLNSAASDVVRVAVVSASNNLIIGNSGTAGVGAPANVFYDVASGGVHQFNVNNTRIVLLSATENRIANSVGYTSFNAAGDNYVQVAIVSATNTLIIGKDGATAGVNGAPTNVLYDVALGGVHQFRVNGGVELQLSSTSANFQNNSILTTGFVAIGSSPATTGSARFDNGAGLYWNSGGGNVRGITIFDGGVFIGDEGANEPTSILHMAAGGHSFRVGGAEQLAITSTSINAFDNNIITTGNLTSSYLEISKSGINAGVTAGLVVRNPDAAAAVDPKYSPSFVLQGESFLAPGTRRETYLRQQLRTSFGGSVTPNFVFSMGDDAEGVSADNATLTDLMTLTYTSLLLHNGLGLVVPGAVLIGSNVASQGNLRLGNNSSAFGRGTGSFDIRIFQVGADDRLYLGDHENAADVVLRAVGAIIVQTGATPSTQLAITDTVADFQDNTIITTGSASIGSHLSVLGSGAAASVGDIRFRHGFNLYAKDSGGSDRLILDWGADDGPDIFRLGNFNSVSNKYFAGVHHRFEIAGVPELVLSATDADFQDNNIITTGYIGYGSTAASTGNFRVHNGFVWDGRNQAGDGNRRLMQWNANDLIIGSSGGTSPNFVVFDGNTGIISRVNGAAHLSIFFGSVDVNTGIPLRSLATAVDDGVGALHQFFKGRNETVVQNSDQIGVLQFLGYDGSNYHERARIATHVSGAPSAGNVPMSLYFYAGDSALTHRWTLDHNGVFYMGPADTVPGSPPTGSGVFLYNDNGSLKSLNASNTIHEITPTTVSSDKITDHLSRRATHKTTDGNLVQMITIPVSSDLRLVEIQITGSAVRTNGIGPLGGGTTAIIHHTAVARRYDADGDNAGLFILASYGALDEFGSTGWSLTVTASGNNIHINVTGASGHDVRWNLFADVTVLTETVDYGIAAG